MPLGLGLAQAGIGLVQSVVGGIRAAKAQKQLENLSSPTYTPNASINDYYNKALQRYNVNPRSTAMYAAMSRNADRGLATGLNALSGRGGAISGTSTLVQGRDDAMLNAEGAAEQEQAQSLGMLGNAAQLKAGEEGKAFDINQMQPFERKYGLLAMKASGGNQIENAGIQNTFGGLQTAANGNMINQMYGVNSGTRTTMRSFGSGVSQGLPFLIP